MKCPHCDTKQPFSRIKKSLRKAQACDECKEGFVLTLSISRMFLLILPAAASLLVIRPVNLHWGISPLAFTALVSVLYVLSCLTLAKRAVN